MTSCDDLSVPYNTNWKSISDIFENDSGVETDPSCLGSSSSLTESTHSSRIGDIQSTFTILRPSEFGQDFNGHQSDIYLTIDENFDEYQNIGDHTKIDYQDDSYSSIQQLSQQNTPLSTFDYQTEKHSSVLHSNIKDRDKIEAGKYVTS